MTIVADPMPVFPTCPTFGFTVQPDILVKIISREGGGERRDRKWQQALRSYTAVPIGPRPQADIEAVLGFWLAIGGMANIFRFKDWSDFKSCPLGAQPSAFDQQLGIIAGSPALYQLQKTYSAGVYSQVRPITRPRGSTILIANTLSEIQAADRWSLDESTGILTPGGGFVGTPGAWGGEFDVPVRFSAPPQIELTNFEIQQLNQAATFIEDRAG